MGNQLVKALTTLGVRFDPPEEHRLYRFETKGFLPLVIEQWAIGSRFQMSVAHYGEQHGDLMKDPDILYEGRGKQLHPIEYQNDYLGLYQSEPDNPAWVKDVLEFTRLWAANIEQQYRPEDRKR